MEKYMCIFEPKECPVKREYKLKPESLVEFCKICASKNRWDILKEGINLFAKFQRSTNVELEKLRMDHEIELAKLRIEHQKEIKKLELGLKETQ